MENWSPQKWIQKIFEERSGEKEDADEKADREEYSQYQTDFSKCVEVLPPLMKSIYIGEVTMTRENYERRVKEARERKKRIQNKEIKK